LNTFTKSIAGLTFLVGSTTLLVGCAVLAPSDRLEANKGKTWYKGNTHTHTLWSDGDAAPEYAVAWYKDHGYDFLTLSDHNTLSRGIKDIPIEPGNKLTDERLAELKHQFGAETIQVHEKEGKPYMRLKTLDQLQRRFEEPGKFILVEGEEITGKTHVNGINLKSVIQPSPSKDNVESMRFQASAVAQQSAETGQPMFAHLDHPNWSEGVSAEEIASVLEVRFFEIFNGAGPGIRHWGNEQEGKPTMAKKWDVILTQRLSQNKDNILYGVGTDDTHNYFTKGANPGRGWIMVLAEELSPNSLVEAILRGDFYSSAGVTLKAIEWNSRIFTVTPQAEVGVSYTTQFIGTRKGYDANASVRQGPDGKSMPHRTNIYSDAVGEVLYETTDVPAVYSFKGDEIYVRAKVTSSALKENPSEEGDFEMAWTQPIVPE
jgi:hypothetical protein